MRIDHLAIWTEDLEAMKDFYVRFFGLVANDKYHNPRKSFTSYFLSFEGGARIELMHREDIVDKSDSQGNAIGLTHFAISLGSKQKVDELTERIRQAGYEVVGEPRTTGDGYYESVIADPEGNWVEITA